MSSVTTTSPEQQARACACGPASRAPRRPREHEPGPSWAMHKTTHCGQHAAKGKPVPPGRSRPMQPAQWRADHAERDAGEAGGMAGDPVTRRPPDAVRKRRALGGSLALQHA